MCAAHKEVEQYIFGVLAKNPGVDLYSTQIQKDLSSILDNHGVDRRVSLSGSGPTVKISTDLLDRLTPH